MPRPFDLDPQRSQSPLLEVSDVPEQTFVARGATKPHKSRGTYVGLLLVNDYGNNAQYSQADHHASHHVTQQEHNGYPQTTKRLFIRY